MGYITGWFSHAFVTSLQTYDSRNVHSSDGPTRPTKSCRFQWVPGTYLVYGSLGPLRVHIPNGISIGLATFAGLMVVTDRQTDQQTKLLRLSQLAESRECFDAAA